MEFAQFVWEAGEAIAHMHAREGHERAKTDSTGHGCKVFVEATGSATCPVRLFERYMEWRGLAEGLLFTTRTGSMMPPGAITSVCRRIISTIGGEERVSSLLVD
jgi:hypothetical protein